MAEELNPTFTLWQKNWATLSYSGTWTEPHCQNIANAKGQGIEEVSPILTLLQNALYQCHTLFKHIQLVINKWLYRAAKQQIQSLINCDVICQNGMCIIDLLAVAEMCNRIINCAPLSHCGQRTYPHSHIVVKEHSPTLTLWSQNIAPLSHCGKRT